MPEVTAAEWIERGIAEASKRYLKAFGWEPMMERKESAEEKKIYALNAEAEELRAEVKRLTEVMRDLERENMELNTRVGELMNEEPEESKEKVSKKK